MKKQSRVLWLYAVILFTIAFVLVLFGAFSGGAGNFNDLFINSTEASLLNLTEQNEGLRAEIEKLKKDIEKQTEESEIKEKDLLEKNESVLAEAIETAINNNELSTAKNLLEKFKADYPNSEKIKIFEEKLLN